MARTLWWYSFLGWLVLNVFLNAWGIVEIFGLFGEDLVAYVMASPWHVGGLVICGVLILALLSSAAQSMLHLWGDELGRAVIGFVALMAIDLAVNAMGAYGVRREVAWPLDWGYYALMTVIVLPFNIGCEWVCIWLKQSGKMDAPAPAPTPKAPPAAPFVMGPRRAATRRTR
jgi:hypothetical protein